MNYKIGLDIGIASVGWATVLLDSNNDPVRIDKMGVRTFDAAEHPKDGSSLAAPRRIARGMRRRTRRHKHRLDRIKYLLEQSGIISQKDLSCLYENSKGLPDIYEIRARALDQILNPEEFARLCVHLAQRRGFKSNRKVEAQTDKETGALTSAVAENAAKMALNGYRTVGEMLYKDSAYANIKRNKAGDYSNTVSRDAMVSEVNAIFDAQKALGSTWVTEEFITKYLEIYTSQRSFESGPNVPSPYAGNQILKMLGKCTFEPQEDRAFKAAFSFEYFNLLTKVNAIRYNGNALTEEQRNAVITSAFNTKNLTYASIRKTLKLEDGLFNISYGQKDIEEIEKKTKFNYLPRYHVMKKEYGEEFDSFSTAKKDALAFALSAYKTDAGIVQYLSAHDFTQSEIDIALTLPSFSGAAHLSIKACQKITVYLQQGQVYSDACQSAGYNFKADDAKPTLLLPANEKAAPELADITNPVVRRAVSQTIKVVNAIIRDYGYSPAFVTVETARELAHNKQERMAIEKRQKENYDKNNILAEEIKNNTKIKQPKGKDILKLKLYKEQDGICMYSQKAIEYSRLFEDGYVEIDHIIPYSISFDDSYKNKVLVLAKENQQKGNRVPLEYVKDKEAYKIWVNNTVRDFGKRERLLKEFADIDIRGEFKERNLNDTKYISRFLLNFIKKYLQFAPVEKAKKQRVMAVNGAVTAYLRRRWGIEKLRGNGDTHHAVDACVIACVTQGMIQRISNYAKYDETRYWAGGDIDRATGEVIDRFPKPYPHFTQEIDMRTLPDPQKYLEVKMLPGYEDKVIKPIFVSRMPKHKVTGAAHKETLRSVAHAAEGTYVSKVPLSSLNLDKNDEIVGYYNPKDDLLLYNALKLRLQQFGGKGEKAFPQGYEFRKPKSDGTPGPVVKKVKVVGKTSSNVQLHGSNAVADNGGMVRVDVFYVPNDGYYLVPIYVADTVKDTLPNLACVAGNRPWKPMKDEHFVFSLYPNDLLKIETAKSFDAELKQKDSTLPKKRELKDPILYYKGTDVSTASLTAETIDGAYQKRSLGAKTAKRITKYQVDILGNISPAPFEPRMAFNIRKGK